MAGKVLIISTNNTLIRKLGQGITFAGFGVTEAVKDIENVFPAMDREKPDLVFWDIAFFEGNVSIDIFNQLETYNVPYFLIGNKALAKKDVLLRNINPYGIIDENLKSAEIEHRLKSIQINLELSQTRESKEVRHKAKSIQKLDEFKIIGRTKKFNSVLKQANQVAKTDATVLILGETGTGKELIARYIHDQSNRKNFKMIALNCATIPSHLLESELFGHEKGSFTGAFTTKIGKLELADKGTIFLDEIAELALDAQSKLLRFIQEKEVEKIGSNHLEKIDVRIIAATNKDLRLMANEGSFRTDLFFRLNTFPITIPPLRERKNDITELAYFFLNRYSQKMGKDIVTITSHTLDVFDAYDWPGNIRELENVIERGVVLCTSTALDMRLEDVESKIPIDHQQSKNR